MTTLNSVELLDIIASLNTKVSAAADSLMRAEQTLASATREAVISGDTQPQTRAQGEVTIASEALYAARTTLAEAERMREAALAVEKAAAEEAARDEIRALSEKLTAVSAEADAAFEAWISKFNEAQRIERDANAVSRTKIGPQAEVFGTVMGGALDSAIRYLASLRAGSPMDREPWHAAAAAKAAHRVAHAAGF